MTAMRDYTSSTRSWLDERFRKTDPQGIYFAHQPIYGYREGHSESCLVERYIRTYRIMNVLSRIPFSTFLDAGGAEGYKASMVKKLFDARVISCDLSGEACARAREIYGIPSFPADVHHLPFEDDAFDVTLCSETIEHVEDLQKAVDELLRVSRKAVIITVPHEPAGVIEKNIKDRAVHAHIHRFDVNSFDFLESRGFRVIPGKMIHPGLRLFGILIEGAPMEHREGMSFPPSVVKLHNVLAPVARRLFGSGTMAKTIELDEWAARRFPSHNALLFVIVKDPAAWTEKRRRRISAREIMKFTVPYHYPGKGKAASA